MKLRMLSAVVICVGAAGLAAQQNPKAETRRVAEQNACAKREAMARREITEKWKDNYNAGEAAAVAGLYADDAYYLTQHFVAGIVEGRTRIQAYVQRGIDAHYHVDSIEILHIACSQDFAYLIDRYTAANAGARAMGVNLVVLRRFDGEWKIVAHEAAVPDERTAVKKSDANG